MTLTMTERPFRSFTTPRRVPKAIVRYAAEKSSGSKRSPFAVLASDPYQDAMPLCGTVPRCPTDAAFEGST